MIDHCVCIERLLIALLNYHNRRCVCVGCLFISLFLFSVSQWLAIVFVIFSIFSNLHGILFAFNICKFLHFSPKTTTNTKIMLLKMSISIEHHAANLKQLDKCRHFSVYSISQLSGQAKKTFNKVLFHFAHEITKTNNFTNIERILVLNTHILAKLTVPMNHLLICLNFKRAKNQERNSNSSQINYKHRFGRCFNVYKHLILDLGVFM